MAGKWHSVGKTLLIVLGAVILLLGVVSAVLNSGIARKVIDNLASENLDGTLDYSRLRVRLFSSFPNIAVELDSVSLTYPHERYAAYDGLGAPSRMLGAGRGPVQDTLARFSRFSVAVNPWQLAAGRIRVGHLRLDGFRGYIHKYDDSTSNLGILPSGGPKDTLKERKALPWISLGSLTVSGKPRVVYTSQPDTIYASLGFRGISLAGNVKIAPECNQIRNLRLELDSLRALGRLPSDTLNATLNWFELFEKRADLYDIRLSGRARARTGSFGRMTVPVALDGTVGFTMLPEGTFVDVRSLSANLAHVPFSAKGTAELHPDSTCVDLGLKIDRCPVDTLLNEYLRSFLEMADDVRTNARISVDATACGALTPEKWPRVEACVKIPRSSLYYKPLDIAAAIDLDVDASATPDKYITAEIDRLKAEIPGASVSVVGSARDLTGGDPYLALDLSAHATLDSLVRVFLASSGIDARGDMDLSASAKARLSQLGQYKFENALLKGEVHSSDIGLRMNGDSLLAQVYRPEIAFNSASDGINLSIDLDSARVAMASGLRARVRGMQNSARLYKVERRGTMLSRLEVASNNSNIFLQTGDTRIGVRGTEISAAIQKKAQRSARAEQSGQRRRADSLRRSRLDSDGRPDFLREKDFAKADVSLDLDSTLTAYFKQWTPTAGIRVKRGFVATPSLPLRTRLRGFSGNLSENELKIDSLSLKCGSSDILASGSVTGLRRVLSGRRGLIDARADIFSERLNVNELISALQKAQEMKVDTTGMAEDDESFVIDTLENAVPDSMQTKLFVLPGNLNANLNLMAQKVDYMQFSVEPAIISAGLKERTMLIRNTQFTVPDLGRIGLDAFYSTKTKQDISAGVDLKLKDVSADGIISMLPTVDSLMPALKSFKGRFNCDVAATTQLDTNMNILMPTLDALVRIQGQDLRIDDAGDLRKITRLLLFKDKNIGHIDDLYVDAVIQDSRLDVFPFVLGVDRYTLALYGSQGFDKSMNYHVSILKSPFLIRFGVNLYGKLDDWHFALGRAKYSSGTVPVFTQVLDTVQINIGSSIRGIYNSGIEGVKRYNEKTWKDVEKKKSSVGYSAPTEMETLSAEEFAKVDSLRYVSEFMEDEDIIDTEELDAGLDAAARLATAYAQATEDKALARKMERLEKKAARKAEREAKKNKTE